MKPFSNDLVPEYANNILIDALGPIPSTKEIAKRLTYQPPYPTDIAGIGNHIRLHQLSSVKSLYIPTQESIQLATTMDLMLRQGYVSRVPTKAETWRQIYGEPMPSNPHASPLAAAVFGISGSGKSTALMHALRAYQQTILHHSFPNMAGPFKQVVWLKIDVPANGKSVDLAEELMFALDNALGTNHFEHTLSSSRKNGSEMLRTWRQKAMGHFLGVLVLDEVQNFFKLDTKRNRSASVKNREKRPELRIVEDEVLKFILTLTNTCGIPIIISGTHDGMKAFSTRFSTSQRLITSGFHHIPYFETPDHPYFKNYFFKQLCNYQWLNKKLLSSDELRVFVHDLGGGVPRLISCLWLFAQRCALERNADNLELADFHRAMATYMAPLVPAIGALKSNDPLKISLYEDLLPADNFSFNF
ncbi:MAG: ATP-binding protein [Burkholderiaceae bacterium]